MGQERVERLHSILGGLETFILENLPMLIESLHSILGGLETAGGEPIQAKHKKFTFHFGWIRNDSKIAAMVLAG